MCCCLKKDGISDQALELRAGSHACACVCFRPPTAFSVGATHSTSLIIQGSVVPLTCSVDFYILPFLKTCVDDWLESYSTDPNTLTSKITYIKSLYIRHLVDVDVICVLALAAFHI